MKEAVMVFSFKVPVLATTCPAGENVSVPAPGAVNPPGPSMTAFWITLPPAFIMNAETTDPVVTGAFSTILFAAIKVNV